MPIQFQLDIFFIQITSDLLDFVVDANLSFNVITKPSLGKLLSNIAGRKIIVPSRDKFMSTLTEKYNKKKTELIRVLAEQQYVCATCDVWSARGNSYIGITIHYITSNFQKKSYVLAFRSITVKQTYNVLAKIIYDVFKEYEIPIRKITHLVTDGGSAFCKAFKIYAKHSNDALIENDRITLEHAEQTDETDAMPFMQDEGEYYVSNILYFDISEEDESSIDDEIHEQSELFDGELDGNIDEEEIDANEINEEIQLPPQRRCVSHLLNLIAGDFEKELNGAAKTVLVHAISKMHTLWVLLGRSSLAKKICIEVIGFILQKPCVTRWNSMFDSVNKTAKAKAKINTLIQRLKKELDSARNLSLILANDWNAIEEYIKVSRPVACALDKLQAEQNGSQGYVIPTLIAMQHHISSQSSRTQFVEYKRAMLHVIDKRFSGYFQINVENQELILAAMSLPRFKDNSFESEDHRRIARQILIAECLKMSNNINSIDTTNHDQPIENTEKDDFFITFNTSNNTRRGSIDNIVETEVIRYLSDQRSNTDMLNEYPLIRKVFMRHSATLSASAVVERLFSQSAIIYTPRRNRLSPNNFEKTLLLKHNNDLIANDDNN